MPKPSRPMPQPSSCKKDANYFKKIENVKKVVWSCMKDTSTNQATVKKWISELEGALETLNSLQ